MGNGGINRLLFRDILAVQTTDLLLSAVLLSICAAFIALTLHEPMAIARGVPVSAHRTAFVVLLSLVVGVSIKAIGVLMVSAFVVIPACASQLISRNFTAHVLFSAGLGAFSAAIGIIFLPFFIFPLVLALL